MSPVHDPRRTSEHRAALLDDGSNVVRREYLKPVILGGIGLTILLIMFATRSGGTETTGDALAIAISIAIQVVLGIPALFIASLIFGGGAGPLNLAIVRLIGIFLAVAPLAVFLARVPCYGWLVVLIMMAGLIMWLFDFETYEAAIVVVVLAGINIGTAIFIIPAFFG